MKPSMTLMHLRDISQRGVPAEMFLLAALRDVRRILPGCAGAFFWLDLAGRVADCCAERLPFAAGEAKGCRDDATFVRRVLEANGAGRASSLDVRDGETLVGRLVVYRRGSAAPWSARELELAGQVPRYLARGLSPQARANAAEGPALHVAGDELLVCDAQGRIIAATDGSRTMLALACGTKLDAEGVASAQRAIAHELRDLCRRLGRHPDACRLAKRTRWGEFSIEARRLSDAARAGAPRVALQVRRHEPAQLRRFDAAGLDGGLSERQREIALQISLGRSNAEIGATLCVSANTVSYHVKSLFAKLGVHNRAALTRKLSTTHHAS